MPDFTLAADIIRLAGILVGVILVGVFINLLYGVINGND